MRKLRQLSALILALSASTSAFAVPCANTSFSGLAAISCDGGHIGNINGDDAELSYLAKLWDVQFAYLGKSDDSGSGPFSLTPGGTTNITLSFDHEIQGEFVIGLKASTHYSYYLFDALSPISSLTFDTTAGVAVNDRGIAQNLSHAALYQAEAATVPRQATAVPEPASWALLAGGLGLIGALARRRTKVAKSA